MLREPRRHRDLESAIDAVAASYHGPEAINNLESAVLPSRRKVVEAFGHLERAIFLGFSSDRTLNRDNLRHGLSEHLYRAYELLLDSIDRALAYQRRRGQAPDVGSDFCEEVVLRLFAQLPALRRALDADVMAAYRGDPAARSLEEVVSSYPSISAVTAHRIAHALQRADVPMIPRIIAEHAHSTTGIDIHPGATIGASFFIDHGTGVVIGETAVIGDRVKLYQNVTLGALSTSRPDGDSGSGKRHPTIEDDVTISSEATP